MLAAHGLRYPGDYEFVFAGDVPLSHDTIVDGSFTS